MKDQDIQGLDNLEIEPLSDEDLEAVAGGLAAGSSGGCCSCKCCSNSHKKDLAPGTGSSIS